jgi:hypothetical protein
MQGLPKKATDQEISELAQDLVANRVYAIEWMSEQDAMSAFGIFVMMGAFDNYYPAALKYIFPFAVMGKDKTSPTAINGIPMFFSMQVWRRSDVQLAVEKANKAREVLNA